MGSASQDLLKQSSETLAGRIGYINLTGFTLNESVETVEYSINDHWLRGGFPNSYLFDTDSKSYTWRENFIKTYIERDIPQLGYNIPALVSRRFLTMCAHNQGQSLNSSKLGESLGISYHTVQSYIDFFEKTFILRVLPSFQANVKKRLIKSPKIYIRDSGLLHSILQIKDFNDLLGNPVFSASWEGYALEQILANVRSWESYYYRSSSGNEIDLILRKSNRLIAIEFKSTKAPKLTKGFYSALSDLNISQAFVISHVDKPYEIRKNVLICNLVQFFDIFKDLD